MTIDENLLCGRHRAAERNKTDTSPANMELVIDKHYKLRQKMPRIGNNGGRPISEMASGAVVLRKNEKESVM